MVKTSIIVVTYNSKQWLKNCLEAIDQLDYSSQYDLIIVDNGSTDGTQEFICSFNPEIRLIQSTNQGFGAGNNLGAKHAKGKYLAFVNPDTIVDKLWLEALIKPLESNSKLVTTSKIVLMDDPSKINTCGNILHFTGFGFVNHFQEQADAFQKDFKVDGISGAAFAMSKENYDKLGGFDEDFFLYMEDVELSWRIRMHQMTIKCITDSIVQHDYRLDMSPQKIEHLEKGRIIILKKYYTTTQWFLLSPSIGHLLPTLIHTLSIVRAKRNKGLVSCLNSSKNTTNKTRKHKRNHHKFWEQTGYPFPFNIIKSSGHIIGLTH